MEEPLDPLAFFTRPRRYEVTPSPPCSVANCRRGTHGGKPFCSEHVTRSQRAQEIVAELLRRARLNAMVFPVLSSSDPIVAEVLSYLRIDYPDGRTLIDAAIDLSLSTAVVKAAIKVLT